MPGILRTTAVAILAMLFIVNSSTAQDCDKYMKKEKDGVISTKDQVLGNVLLEKHLVAFLKEEGKTYIEYYKTDMRTTQGIGGSATSTMIEDANVDTVRIELALVNRKKLLLKFDANDSKVTMFSMRGTGLHHYFRELSAEELQLLTEARVKEYRVLKYQGDKQERLESQKWKAADMKDGQDLQNAAKCFAKSAK